MTTPDEGAIVHKLFSHLGMVEEVPESQMNAISALSGSGPAFVSSNDIFYTQLQIFHLGLQF